MTTNKLILGFTGQMASGKTTAARYVMESRGANSYRFSTVLRDVLDRIHQDNSRENLQTCSSMLRETFGEDILAKVLTADVAADEGHIVVVDGIRRPSDVSLLRNMPGFVLVKVFGDIEKRFERITARSENPDDQGKTLEEFKNDHKREAEEKIEEISAEADEQIDNNGTLGEFHAAIDAIITKYGDQG